MHKWQENIKNIQPIFTEYNLQYKKNIEHSDQITFFFTPFLRSILFCNFHIRSYHFFFITLICRYQTIITIELVASFSFIISYLFLSRIEIFWNAINGGSTAVIFHTFTTYRHGVSRLLPHRFQFVSRMPSLHLNNPICFECRKPIDVTIRFCDVCGTFKISYQRSYAKQTFKPKCFWRQ